MEGSARRVAGCRRGLRRRHRIRSQATIEFAFAAPLFLACLLGAIDAGLWAVQTSAEVAAVEQGARVAASAGSAPTARIAPDAREVVASVVVGLRTALFGTGIVAWCGREPGAGCTASAATCPSTPVEVQAALGPRMVAVCVSEQDPPACTTPPPGAVAPFPAGCGDSPMITVRVIGYLAALVPPGFGPGSAAGEIPTDIAATTHTLRFAP